jgi:hypothetical protein
MSSEMRASKPGTVMIAEDMDHWPHVDVVDLARREVDFSTLDPSDVFCWTGRFTAHWQSGDNRSYRDGPDEVSAEEAIAWGRSQADVVFIRVGDGDLGGDESGYFSAGTRHPDPETPVWPEGTSVTARPYQGEWKRAGVGEYEIGGGSS